MFEPISLIHFAPHLEQQYSQIQKNGPPCRSPKKDDRSPTEIITKILNMVYNGLFSSYKYNRYQRSGKKKGHHGH